MEDSDILCPGNPLILIVPIQTDIRICAEFVQYRLYGGVGGAIVHHDDLNIGIGLADGGTNRLFQKRRIVIYRNNNGNFRFGDSVIHFFISFKNESSGRLLLYYSKCMIEPTGNGIRGLDHLLTQD